MSDYLSRHPDCDDMRHFVFARRCPGFHPPRANPDRYVWGAICVALVGIVVWIALANVGVINP